MNLISMTIIVKATVTISIFSIISITSISIPRSFHPPCTDFKHTQALHEMQNAPLWVQRQRPGSSQGQIIDITRMQQIWFQHQHFNTSGCQLSQICWLWLLPTWSHMHVPLTFFQKSCAKGRRNQLNMDEYGYGTHSAKQISAYHVRSLNWQPLPTTYKINANSSHPQTLVIPKLAKDPEASYDEEWWRNFLSKFECHRAIFL